MFGPDIVARTINKPTVRGNKTKKAWHDHGRSDVHSKVACWAVLFDLIESCDVFQAQAQQGKVSFAVNHLMVGPINKTLDLVVCAVPKDRKPSGRRTFAGLGQHYGIQLSSSEQALLAKLPVMEEELSSDVSEVLIALEAKACFTDLVGSIPRLHAEILATGYLAKQAASSCIAVSYTLVNAANSFVSPGKQGTIKKHNQPSDAKTVLSFPRNFVFQEVGYNLN